MHYIYANRKNRDAKAKELRAQGVLFKKSCIRDQLCDPRYMEDYEASMGQDYQTYFKSVYILNTY